MRHPLGFKVSADYRVIDCESPRSLTFQTTSGGPIRPAQHYELTVNTDGSTTVRSIIAYHPRGLMQIALPVLALLHPLFAWEASWIDNARDEIDGELRAAISLVNPEVIADPFHRTAPLVELLRGRAAPLAGARAASETRRRAPATWRPVLDARREER